MDKLINSHIDELEAIESEMDAIVEESIKAIDIKALAENPVIELTRIKDELKEIFVGRYAPEIIKIGNEFAQTIQGKIEEDKALKIDKSKDPNLNE